MSFCSVLREEFRLANFGFSYKNQDVFTYSQWRWPRGVFLAFRIFTALWCSGCFIYLVIAVNDAVNNIMTYLTTWTYLLLTLYLVSAACVAIFTKQRHSNGFPENNAGGIENIAYTDSDKPTIITMSSEHNTASDLEKTSASHGKQGSCTIEIAWYMKMNWLLGSIVYVFAIIVTTVYFGFLFPLIGKTNFLDVNLHGVNTFFVLIDACLIARPVRLLHVIYPVMYGALYLAFSAIYWNADKVNHVLYPGVLDWNFPAHTAMVICLLTFIGLPLVQIMHYGVYRLRLFIYKRAYGEDFEKK